MSLDKQRILSELGSVMNQLQSADCGCMGKLFSNSNQVNVQGAAGMGAPLPTCGGCRRGCCHGHGYGHGMPNAGEPYPGNMNRSCMGHCNPPKLYADTYNYLNDNLMQPVVQEVYNDLKTITPANTVMNNPMANKMGLGQGNDGNLGSNGINIQQSGEQFVGKMANPMQDMPNNMKVMPAQNGQQPMCNMGGMGPEITKMILGEGRQKQINPQMPRQGQINGQMLIDAPQSPHGQIGVAPLIPPNGQMNTNTNQAQYASDPNQGLYNTSNVGAFGQANTMQTMNTANNAQSNPLQRNVIQNHGNVPKGNVACPAAQQRAVTNQQPYGQHTQGVVKFNEMFPGVMQGGDLGFDPMAIAIQMNPANQQKTAIDTMQKLMNGVPMNRTGYTAQANAAQPQSAPTSQNQENTSSNQPYTNMQIIPPAQNMNLQNGQIDNTNAGMGAAQLSAVPGAGANQQQIYRSLEPQSQSMIDPKVLTTIPRTISGNEGESDPNSQIQPPPVNQTETISVPQIKEPIFPADTSKNHQFHYTSQKPYEYNTLGQPVQMLPAQLFHPPEPSLPQTLSPQPVPTKMRNDQMKYSNVKSTVSKTSIIGNKVGRAMSKSQLQHIYNQYKGSQSYTQQNVTSPVQAPTRSDGKLNVTLPSTVNPQLRAPVEKVGGDTAANSYQGNEKEQIMGQVGDVPTYNKPQGDTEPVKASRAVPTRQAKLRNGLQDVVYTSYPSSAAWSFHGTNDHRPIPVGYRFREFRR